MPRANNEKELNITEMKRLMELEGLMWSETYIVSTDEINEYYELVKRHNAEW